MSFQNSRWSPNTQCNDIWSWSLREIIKLEEVRRGCFHDGIRVIIERRIRAPFLSTMLGYSEKVEPKKRVIRTWPRWHPNVKLQVSGTVKKGFLFLNYLIYSISLWQPELKLTFFPPVKERSKNGNFYKTNKLFFVFLLLTFKKAINPVFFSTSPTSSSFSLNIWRDWIIPDYYLLAKQALKHFL